MQATSNLYDRILAESHYVEYKLSIAGSDVPSTDIESMTLTGSLYTDYGIGNCNLRQANITVQGVYNTGDELIVYARLVSNVDGAVSEWIRFCTLVVFSREVVESIYTVLTAYDRLCLTEYVYKRQPTWQNKTMLEVVQGICADIDISLTAHAQGLIPSYTVADPNNMTAREILQNIAVAAAANWCTNANGELELKLATIPSYVYTISGENIEKDTFKSKQTYSSYVGVELEGQTLVYRSPSGLTSDEWDALEETGRIMSTRCEWATQEMADGILSVLSRAEQYKPWRANVNVDIAAELGDGVLVQGVESVLAEYSLSAEGSRLFGEIAGPGISNIEYLNPYTPEVERRIAAETDAREASITVLEESITLEAAARLAGDESISSTVSTLQITATSIDSRVEAIEGDYATSTQLTQTESSLTATISQKASSSDLSSLEGRVSTNENTLADYEKYITLDTNGITISDSEGKINGNFDNGGLQFTDSAGTKVAWVDGTNSQLGANELSIGDYTTEANRWRIFTWGSGAHLTFTRHD